MDRKKRFEKLAIELGGFLSAERVRYRCLEVFKDIDIEGKTILEIGAGAGVLSGYAAVNGAKYVLAIEPMADGSKKEINLKINRMRHELGCDNFEIATDPIQDFLFKDKLFDIIIMYNSINHLDEEACKNLKKSEEAKNNYRKIFRKIIDLMKPGGLLLIADCSRYNLFGMIGLKNPIVPSVTWKLHQTPQTWERMIRPFGFTRERLVWRRIYPLRFFGWLTANCVTSFFLYSHFLLWLRYSDTEELYKLG